MYINRLKAILYSDLILVENNLKNNLEHFIEYLLHIAYISLYNNCY